MKVLQLSVHISNNLYCKMILLSVVALTWVARPSETCAFLKWCAMCICETCSDSIYIKVHQSRIRNLTLIWQFRPSWATDFFRLTSSSASNFRFSSRRVTSGEGHKHDIKSRPPHHGCRGGSHSEEIYRPWRMKLSGQCQIFNLVLLRWTFINFRSTNLMNLFNNVLD